MKLGILGSGNIVSTFFADLKSRNNFEITAICGREQSKEKIEKLAFENNVEKIYYNYDEMLADDHIDTIYVALPNAMHYTESLKALETGKNVICEKPFTVTLKELQHLVKVASENKLFLFEAIIPMHLKNFYAIKEDVKKLGELKLLNIEYCQYSSRYDAFKSGETPTAFDPLYAGGALMDLNIYNLHFAIGICGKPVNAKYYPNMERGVDTSGVIIMEYPDFKAILTASKDCKAAPSAKILGTNGTITVHSAVSLCTGYTIEMNQKGALPEKINVNENEFKMVSEFNNFAKYIDEKDYDTCNELLSQSLSVMEVCEKVRTEAGIEFNGQL